MLNKIKNNIQLLRTISQIFFTLLVILIGYEFHIFIKYLNHPISETFYRPPGVEAFLPISSLMNLYYFILSGEIHPYHPAGLFIFIAICLMSFVIAKSFCSWVCPVGFLSETIGDFADKIYYKLFKRTPKLPRFIDYILRSLKYIILFFFVYVIFFSMTEFGLKAFLDSDYNLMSDIKMYHFFVDISRFSLITIGVLFLLSIIVRNFWCRFLCPYGALLGIIGLLSPNKITREKTSCIDCKKCNKVCPSRINIAENKRVISDECVSCLKCIETCPVENTLNYKTSFLNYKLKKQILAPIILMSFLSLIIYTMLTNNWQNEIKKDTYIEKYKNIDQLSHPTSAREAKELNKIKD